MAKTLPVITFQEKKLSHAQQAFNRYLKRVQKLKKQLVTVEERTQRARLRYQREIVPLVQFNTVRKARLVRVLYQQHLQRGLRKKEKEKLSTLIRQLAQAVLQGVCP